VLLVGRTGRSLCAIGMVVFGLTFVAGIVESLRVERRLPVIDLIVSGPEDHIQALVVRKNYNAAIEQLQMQARLQPSDPATFEHLGNLLGTQARPREARTQFLQLLRLRPDYAEGYDYLGATYLNTGELTLAARCFEQAIRLKPELPLAHNNLGVAKARQGDVFEAEKCFAKAVELSPNYENARINLDNARKTLRQNP
jgi:Flp pilus assembly protein TadD